jgi:GNAT superfamily N-acetyltransferase
LKFHLSTIDRERFGFVTGKVDLDSKDTIEAMQVEAQRVGAELLIVRLSTDEIKLAQELEKNGGILTDTLVYYQKNLTMRYDSPLLSDYEACLVGDADISALEKLSAESFKDYFGHYHADSRLNRFDCDQVYASWAFNSCSKGDFSDEVILIKNKGDITAFATLKKIDRETIDGVLYAVAPNYRGKGLHLALMKLSHNWCIDHGFNRFTTSTQINNLKVQKNWCRIGMEPFKSIYTFHIWT